MDGDERDKENEVQHQHSFHVLFSQLSRQISGPKIEDFLKNGLQGRSFSDRYKGEVICFDGNDNSVYTSKATLTFSLSLLGAVDPIHTLTTGNKVTAGGKKTSLLMGGREQKKQGKPFEEESKNENFQEREKEDLKKQILQLLKTIFKDEEPEDLFEALNDYYKENTTERTLLNMFILKDFKEEE